MNIAATYPWGRERINDVTRWWRYAGHSNAMVVGTSWGSGPYHWKSS